MTHKNETYYSTKKVHKLMQANRLPCSSSHQNVKKKFASLGIELVEEIPAEWDRHALAISESDLIKYLNEIKQNSLNGERQNVTRVFEGLGLTESKSNELVKLETNPISQPIARKPSNSKRLNELKKEIEDLKAANIGLVTERNDLTNQLELAKLEYENGLAKTKLDLTNETFVKLEKLETDLVNKSKTNTIGLVAKWEKIKSDLVTELDLVKSRLAESVALNEKFDKELNQVTRPKDKSSVIEWFTYYVYYTFRHLFKLTKTKPFLFAAFCLTCIVFVWHGGEYYYSIAGGSKMIGYAMAGVFESAALVMTLHGYDKNRLAVFAFFSGLILFLYLCQFVTEWHQGGIFVYPFALAFAQYSFGDKLANETN